MLVLSLSVLLSGTLAAQAGPTIPGCAAIAAHVDAAGARGPVFLRSYEKGPDEAALPPPLAGSAFAYDNALAIVALVACHDVPRARRIADAFVIAIEHDRTFKDGRVRNAYRAGPVDPSAPKMPGWWDAQQNLWAEDAYQDGTQTGNVAWVALALLALNEAGPDAAYRDAAVRLGSWIAENQSDARAPGGFSGGQAGFDPRQTRLDWRSTEHNVDVSALGSRLTAIGETALGDKLVRGSRTFLDAMFDATSGAFRLGTKPDGTIQPSKKIAMDALIWPIVGVADAPSDWRRSLAYAKANLNVQGGYDFNGDRDGLWSEGTAQMAFVQRSIGDGEEASKALGALGTLTAPSGYLYATGKGRITTGIAIGPDSTTEDFCYFHRPHLGATAWAVLAATGFNPFDGRPIR